jgi:hypothetical protein
MVTKFFLQQPHLEFVISRGINCSLVCFRSSDVPCQFYDTVNIRFLLTLSDTLTGPMDSGAAIYPMLLPTEPTCHITTELAGE